MAKFYVQCGPFQAILVADTVRQAALAAVDRSLQTHLWIYDDRALSQNDRRNHLMLEALMHLDPTIRISEKGFDRSDAAVLGTPETIGAWHRLMGGINRLFLAAGLAPRTMTAHTGTSDTIQYQPPRMPK